MDDEIFQPALQIPEEDRRRAIQIVMTVVGGDQELSLATLRLAKRLDVLDWLREELNQ